MTGTRAPATFRSEIARRMLNPFVRRLEIFAPLSVDQRREVESLTARVLQAGPRTNLLRDGDEPRAANVVLSGWACRYKVLPDGRRQIISLFLPGDMCEPYAFLLGPVDHAVGTLTPVSYARVSAPAIRDVTASSRELAEALWWQTLVAVEIQREWTVSLGRRTALERLAHLFCEVMARLADVGLADGRECEMPLIQTDLADATGLSTVHVNRSLQDLRASGLIDLRAKRLVIHDREGLAELAMFDPTYLHRLPGSGTGLHRSLD